MKRGVVITAGVLAAGLGLWIALYPGDWQNWLGFSQAAYFKDGQNYAFFSGFGPMLLTAGGLSTIIGGLFRHLNCHTAGCPRIIRHKIADGEYGVCGKHWREVNGHDASHKYSVAQLRDRHHAHTRAKP